jgi:hypothetical protein
MLFILRFSSIAKKNEGVSPSGGGVIIIRKKFRRVFKAKVPTPSVPETGKPRPKGRPKRQSGSPVSGVRGFAQMHFESSEQLRRGVGGGENYA